MKKNVILLFGGRSTEHEVSVVSARAISKALNRDRFNVIPVGITKEGTWLRGPEVDKALEQGKPLSLEGTQALMLPNPGAKDIIELSPEEGVVQLREKESVDVVFPVLHGKFGEDGTVQGIFEMANLPYVGCGVLGSALGIDKAKQKEVCAYHGIPCAKFISIDKARWAKSREAILGEIEEKFGGTYPLFVKPINTGSSVGITKARDRTGLATAIDVASGFDFKIIIEEGIGDIREIEVAVLGNYEPIASACGEIVPGNEFYDYDAKYHNDDSTAIIPAPLSKATSDLVRHYAVKAFQLLECRGLSRVDFFVSKNDESKIWFNEVNTLPGFTPISMYPKLWEHAGIGFSELVEKLIALAIEDWEWKQTLKTSKS